MVGDLTASKSKKREKKNLKAGMGSGVSSPTSVLTLSAMHCRWLCVCVCV